MKYQIAASALGILLGAGASADPQQAEDPHAHHHLMASGLQRTESSYEMPKVSLVREDGQRVTASDLFGDGRPLAVDFIYTTCQTICPLTSQIFSQFQDKLAAAHQQIHLISISIDPEQDTPARLREYAKKFAAGPNWDHYTGTIEASIAVQRAFKAYRGDKMNHAPLTLLRAAHGTTWVRLEGLANADDLMAEFIRLEHAP